MSESRLAIFFRVLKLDIDYEIRMLKHRKEQREG